MGTILNIVEVVDKLTENTQDRAARENKTFREILDEEMKKINKSDIDTKVWKERYLWKIPKD